jgi:hypothetical protein
LISLFQSYGNFVKKQAQKREASSSQEDASSESL